MHSSDLTSTPFSSILAYFPEIELPVTLTDRDFHSFSANNDPLPGAVVEHFFIPMEDEEVEDAFTEYVPCFSLPGTEAFGFSAIVYWKASLLNYTYFLATFSKEGALIDRKELAGTFSREGLLKQSVATIESDWMIYVVEGVQEGDQSFVPESSKAFQLELLVDGRIIFPSWNFLSLYFIPYAYSFHQNWKCMEFRT